MDDLLAEFLTETGESLAELDLALIKLERAPDDAPTLALVFRSIHTIKGTCGFLGLPRLEQVAHAAESVLVAIREGEMTPTARVVSLILKALDGIRSIFPAKLLITAINEPGTLGAIATVIGENGANIANVVINAPSPDFRTLLVDVQVGDVKHLSTIISQLRARPVVSKVERING